VTDAGSSPVPATRSRHEIVGFFNTQD